MPKATISYDLDEYDDKVSFKIANKSGELIDAIRQYDNWLRNQIKYDETRVQDELLALEEAREKLWKELDDCEVTSLFDY